MNENVERIRKNIHSMIVTAFIDVIAMMAIGVGIVAKVSAPQARFIADERVVNVILGGGIALALWCGYRFLKLARERNAIRSTIVDD